MKSVIFKIKKKKNEQKQFSEFLKCYGSDVTNVLCVDLFTIQF